METILNDIRVERQKQDEKWGKQNHLPIEWIAILTEEVGEASKEALDHHFRNGASNPKLKAGESLQKERLVNYRKELIQVAAVAVAMVEDLDEM